MNKIEIIPLGGVGEFGMNCMAIRCNEEIIIVDAGMGFPEESAYGVDISIPNFDFLEKYRSEITALVLTHGHEDHIGGVPYFLKRFNVPVYGSHYTLALCERKFEEHNMLDDVLMHRIEAGQTVSLHSFEIEFINVTHSQVDCFLLAISTPAGKIIHTGDYKFDDTPVIGKPTDVRRLKELSDEGILALFTDSTNSTIAGRTPSEKAVIPGFEQVFDEAAGRIFVSTFASSTHRLQVVFDVAADFGRKVCVVGRSMLKNVEIAEEFGYLNIQPNIRVSIADSLQLEDDEIVYLVTGSQGEVQAALSQIALASYKGIRIKKGDTVVLSARIIPGNEKNISELIGNIYKHGGNIIEEKRRLVHVSGHGARDDIRMMIEATRPKFVVPIHGEYWMLFRLEEFVKNHLNYAPENIKLIENGDVLEITEHFAGVSEHFEIGRTFISDDSLTEVGYETVRERKKLAYGGAVALTIVIESKSKKLVAEPQIRYQGLAAVASDSSFAERARNLIADTVESLPKETFSNESLLKETLRIALMRLIKQENGTKPVIIPTIIEI